MQYSIKLLAAGLVAQTGFTWAAPQARNFIYIVPDGYGQASQTMARDYASLQRTGSNASAPIVEALAGDRLVLGTVRTHSSDSLITDSAASGTAYACGHKTYNDAISVLPSGEPVASVLESAKLAGFKTALVVTSTINHATPAVYSAHVADRDSYEAIAAQQIGYNHPFGPVVDILLGGGRCYFKPMSDPTSCRSDALDLFGFAEEKGYHVMQDRAAFDDFTGGYGAARIPYIGLFNDDQMMYEIDRSKVPKEEPSLLEMSKAALKSLDAATSNSTKGYFIMIEASRIDHAGHANDAAAHVHDTLMYNDVLAYAQEWIDEHPDTLLMSAADHECGGLTTNGFDPTPLFSVEHSFEYLEDLWAQFNGTDRRAYFTSTILPAAGLAGTSQKDIDAMLAASSPWAQMKSLIAKKAGVNWSTGGHTATDVNLHGYAAGEKLWREFKGDMAGNHDNTRLPRYIEEVLGLDLDGTTGKLRAVNGSWIAGSGVAKRRVGGKRHSH